MTYYDTLESPIGPLLLTGDGASLTGLYMETHQYGPESKCGWIHDPARFVEAKRQLNAYFAGTLKKFDLPLAMEGTAFRKAVWEELKSIPFGVTVTYGDIAKRLGTPNGSRAVGGAVGHNPISIIVPCHRVIGTDGSLTGFGGGLERKVRLLELEGVDIRRAPQPSLSL